MVASDQNLVSLHEHLDDQFRDYREDHRREHDSIEQSIERNRTSVDYRLDAYVARIDAMERSLAQLAEYRKGHEREHELTGEAITRARQVVDNRLAEMNEMRAQILSERGGLVQRSIFEALEREMVRRMGTVENAVGKLSARVATAFGAVTFGLVALELILRYFVK